MTPGLSLTFQVVPSESELLSCFSDGHHIGCTLLTPTFLGVCSGCICRSWWLVNALELALQAFDRDSQGHFFSPCTCVGDKWIFFLFLILCRNYKKGVSPWLERNAFPKDEFRQLYLIENSACLSLNTVFPGDFFPARRMSL